MASDEISSLKPVERHRVYDLVREAGIDVSDWANYIRSESPASNPKYCYNWVFEGPDRVVLCLWHEEMRQDDSGIFQELNYREIAARVTGPRRTRAEDMQHAIKRAYANGLSLRIIVVDGVRDVESELRVERRLLDPMPWHVAYYDESGNSRLQRGRRSSQRGIQRQSTDSELQPNRQMFPARPGTQKAPESRQIFRQGTDPTEYSPEHSKMQEKLLEELQAEYGKHSVWLEKNFVDVSVETEKELIYFEIKTNPDARSVIRQAIGQILEYAYHPSRKGRRPDKLVIVGCSPLEAHDKEYLACLVERFNLPLSYRVIEL